MNDEEFENRIRTLLVESVEHRTAGSTRVAPPFEAPAVHDRDSGHARRSGRWILPLAAAACIAVIVGGVVVVQNLTASHAPTVDTPTHAPVPAPSTMVPPTQAPTTAVPPTSAPTGAARSTHASTPTTVTEKLGDATIVLPAGWKARSLPGAGSGASSSVPEKQAWCLSPASLPKSKATVDDCPLVFGTIDPAGSTTVDVDTQGGFSSDPEYCRQYSQLATETESAQTRSFGGRSADWRSWTIRCTTGQAMAMEQYVVATDPGYVLESQAVTSTIHDAMTEIAQNSTLPARTSSLRLFDRGRITSISTSGSHTSVTLHRVYKRRDRNGSSYAELAGPTVTYTVPTAMWSQAQAGGALRRGSVVQLTSNGSKITSIFGN